jgi:hypothetical protein
VPDAAGQHPDKVNGRQLQPFREKTGIADKLDQILHF